MLIYSQTIELASERSKFETIYLLYRDLLYRAALAILKNPQDAEDAVHSAFVSIAENLGKIGAADNPKTKGYIVTIVRNSAINIYRKKQNHPRSEYLDAVAGVQRQYDGGNDVAKCMLKLPERQRAVIVLKYCHGYSLKEIAAMLDISYQNVLKIEQRAKAKLRSLCAEEGIEC